jgi:hypothetical protein
VAPRGAQCGRDAHVALLCEPLNFEQPAACIESDCASPAFCATSEGILGREGPAQTAKPRRHSPPNGEETRSFKILNHPDRDPSDLTKLRADLAGHRQQLHNLLEQGSRCRDPKTSRFSAGCSHTKGAVDVHHHPRRAGHQQHSRKSPRHAVLWRKQSYGTQTDHGDRLVERLLTIRETCRLPGRRLHDYLTTAITAGLYGQPVPAPSPPKPFERLHRRSVGAATSRP